LLLLLSLLLLLLFMPKLVSASNQDN